MKKFDKTIRAIMICTTLINTVVRVNRLIKNDKRMKTLDNISKKNKID